MTLSNVSISSKRGPGAIVVDGADLSNCVRAVDVRISHDSLPIVRIEMVACNEIDLTGASLVVTGMVMPESIEKAILAYLLSKSPEGYLDITTIGDTRQRLVAKSPA